MSLAIYAAPFDNDNTTNNDNTTYTNVEKKRQQHNRTQKRNPPSEKVNSILEKIHSNLYNEDNNLLGNYPSSHENNEPILFNPPPKPESMSGYKIASKENKEPHKEQMTNLGNQPHPNYEKDNLELNNIQANYGDSRSATEYYKKMIPNYKDNSAALGIGPGLGHTRSNGHSMAATYDNVAQDVLLQKLNYMIHLLEEQQDEKTNNVTEEVILYSFLGIFIIFVCDSFARVGKYVR
jgi:hypothetical protein